MLKFGDTYFNFGGNYLTGWDYHKDPVLENGWNELYNINSYKEFTSNNNNSADYFYRASFGMNNAYIMSAWEGDVPKVFTTFIDSYGNPLSDIIQTSPIADNSALQEDKVHIDDKNFTYLLYKFQIAPHSVGGTNDYIIPSSTLANQIYNHSNPIVRFSIGDKFSVENSYVPSDNTSVQMMLPDNVRFLCSSYKYDNKLTVDGTTSVVNSGIYDYTIKLNNVIAYIRPQTFNYLIKLNENNIDVSAYINEFEQSATMNFAYSGTYDLNPSYFKESWKKFKIYGTNVGNWYTKTTDYNMWGYRSPIIEEVGLSAYYENELNYENFKNLALRSFTANYVPTGEG